MHIALLVNQIKASVNWNRDPPLETPNTDCRQYHVARIVEYAIIERAMINNWYAFHPYQSNPYFDHIER